MKFFCEKKDILKATNIVSKAVAIKSVLPILECILIKTENNCVVLKGSDTTLSIKTNFPAQISDSGCVAVPSRLFQEIISKYPSGEMTIWTDENNTLNIKSGSSKASLAFLECDEFPDFPNENLNNKIDMPEITFKSLINQTIFATAITDDKPILKGVLFEKEGNKLNVVALDRFRLAMRSEEINTNLDDLSVVIPSRSLRECAKILEDNAENISICISKNCVAVCIGETRIYTRLLEGDYVKYKNILPTNNNTIIKIEKEEFLEAIERASILSREENNNLIKITVMEDTISITANSEIGKAYEEVTAIIEGKELEIAFNARYLTDVLKNIDDTEINIYMNTNVSPCLIRSKEGDSFLYLILPVQIRG